MTMTTRSQLRRKKVRQDLAGTVPQAQPVCPSVTHSQVLASTMFPGGLVVGHGPSAAAVKRCLQASMGQSVILVGAGGGSRCSLNLCHTQTLSFCRQQTQVGPFADRHEVRGA